MTDKATHYDEVRTNNLNLIRNLLRIHNPVSKTELGELSGLTFPTVSAVLSELLNSGEIIKKSGFSSGGRPGAVFALNPNYTDIVCMTLKLRQFEIEHYDYCGSLKSTATTTVDENADEAVIEKIFSDIKATYPKTRVAIMGIDGVVVDGVIKYLPYLPKLEGKNLFKLVMDKFNIRLFIENDINTIAIGESDISPDFAHIFWNEGCIGSAIILGGKLLHGSHGCAGELEFICDNHTGKLEFLTKALLSVSCVIDVPLIAISGSDITKTDIDTLKASLQERLGEFRKPEIIYVADEQNRYENGLWQIAMKYYKEHC